MRKLGLVLAMILLLSGCSVKSESVMEYVEDELKPAVSEPYRIVFGVPEGVTQETFGQDGLSAVYEAENGDFTITTEVMAATTVDEAITQVTGLPREKLDVLELNRFPMTEYHFAWASYGEETETVSRAALIAGEDHYYVMTMTQKSGLGDLYQETADAVFASFGLSTEEEI